jgi:hypothetical protein
LNLIYIIYIYIYIRRSYHIYNASSTRERADRPKKSLKIPKGQSESVNRRSTDNTMAKTKRTEEQTTIYKTLYIKLDVG